MLIVKVSHLSRTATPLMHVQKHAVSRSRTTDQNHSAKARMAPEGDLLTPWRRNNRANAVWH